ncbi:MAG: DUF885 domain-containing protein [Candidatus Polarisedimenticolia bacterium]
MDARLDRLVDDLLAFRWDHNPVQATAVGFHHHDHRLKDADPAAIGEAHRGLQSFLETLRRLRAETPFPAGDDELDARLVEDHLEVEIRVREEVRPEFRDPSHYLEEVLYGVYYLVQRDFAPLPERAASAARRLGEVPRLLRQARANLTRPAEIPETWVRTALEEAGGSQAFFRELDTGLVPRAGTAAGELRHALAEASSAIDEYARFLEDRVRPGARGIFAVGRELFEFLLGRQHGLEPDAAALRAFGEAQVREARAALDRAARALDPSRDWRQLVESWNADHPTRETFVREYADEVHRARDFVAERRLVSLPAGEVLHVVATPSFQRSLCPFAAYLPAGPFEANQEGFLWVTPPDPDAHHGRSDLHLRDHPRPSIAGTMVHEAYPGHHLQLSVANRHPSRVRRLFTTPVFVEGWAFYCEQMMAEEGFFHDPRSRVLQLKDQLWRACRVVIDVGLQTGTMGLEEAAVMLHQVARLGLESARSEVLRYTRSPTQPMSYAVGKHEILRLRDDYRGRRGGAFRLQEFHDALLSFGSIPVSLLRERLLAEAA